MGFIKREYKDKETIITAENLNEIQDAIIALEDGLFSVDDVKSGEIITITDAAKRGFRGLNIYGKTTQRKTTGVQMIPMPYKTDGVTAGGVTFKQQADGSVKCSGTATSTVYYAMFGGYAQDAFPIPEWLVEGETYTISGGTNKVGVAVFLYKDDGTAWQNVAIPQSTFVMPTGFSYIGIFVYCPSGVVADSTIYPMLNAGSTAFEYEPYTGGKPAPSPDYPQNLVSIGNSGSITVNVTGGYDAKSMTIVTPNGLPGIPVKSSGNYTDANGQRWICDEVDLARGVYVRRVTMVNLGVLTSWNTWGVNSYLDGQTGFYHYLSYAPISDVALCNILPYSEFAWGGMQIGVSVAAASASAPMYITVSVPTSILSDVSTNATACASLATMLGDVGAYMLIATSPIETPLSEEELAAYADLHTYRNNTTVSNDAGAYMELEYVMDAKKYIDSLITSGGSSATILNATVE